MSENCVVVAAQPHPLKDETLQAIAAPGQTIAELLGPDCADTVQAWLNDRFVPRFMWRHVRPKAGAVLTAKALAHGNKSQTLQLVLSVASLAIGGLGGALFYVAGSYLISMVRPPVPIPEPVPSSFNRLKSITGTRNEVNPYGVVPRVYGRHRIFPPYAAKPFTELVGQDSYFRVLLCLGYGPLDCYDLKIGDSPLTDAGVVIQQDATLASSNFSEITYQISSAPTLFSDNVSETTYNLALDTDGTVQVLGTPARTREISFDLLFPNGLFARDVHVNRGTGLGWAAARIGFTIEYRITGAGAWTNLATAGGFSGGDNIYAIGDLVYFEGRVTAAMRSAIRWAVPTEGAYEVRITRTKLQAKIYPQAVDCGANSNPPVLESYREWRDESSFFPPEDCNTQQAIGKDATLTVLRAVTPLLIPMNGKYLYLAMRIKATDQFTGIVDSVNLVAQSKLTAWNGATFAETLEANPAWVFLDVLSGAATERPADKTTRFWLDELKTWADECTAKGRTYSAVIDSPTTCFDLARDVASVGRASYTNRDGKHTVVRDSAGLQPVQVFSPRNSASMATERQFLDLPHALRCRFVNPALGYQQDEVVAYDDGYGDVDRTNYVWPSDDFTHANYNKVNLGGAAIVITPNALSSGGDLVTGLDTANDRLDWATNPAIPAQNSGPWTFSIELSGSGNISINVSTTTGVGGAGEAVFALTSTPTRRSVSHTFGADATGTVRIHAVITRSGVAPVSLYIGKAQLERGLVATGYIHTETGPVTIRGTTATRFESIELRGVTDHDQAWREGRYRLAQRRLRPEVHSLTVDVESLVARRGDVVRFQNDALVIGQVAGRIKAVAGDVLTLDQNVEMISGTVYAIRIRKNDGSVVVQTVVVSTGEFSQVTLAASVAGITAGDLFVFGISGNDSIACKIARIEPQDGLRARLLLVADDPAIYTAEDGEPPQDDRTASDLTRPQVPYVHSARSDEAVLLESDNGALLPRILVLFGFTSNRNAAPATVEAQVRNAGVDPWRPLPTLPFNANELSITDVVEGQAYDVRLRAVTATGIASEWNTTVANHIVIGRTSPPPDVATFYINGRRLVWSYDNPPRDLAGFLIRYNLGVNTAWDDATPAHSGTVTAPPFDALNIPSGTVTILIKAVDIAGFVSTNAAAIIGDLPDAAPNNVEYQVDDYSLTGFPRTTDATIPNADAESGTAADWVVGVSSSFAVGWFETPLAVTAVAPGAGAFSFVSTGGPSVAYSSKAFPVLPGQTFRVNTKYKGADVSAGYYVAIIFRGSEPASGYVRAGFDQADEWNGQGFFCTAGASFSAAWQNSVGAPVTVPQGCYWASIFVYNLTTPTFYFDDVELIEDLHSSVSGTDLQADLTAGIFWSGTNDAPFWEGAAADLFWSDTFEELIYQASYTIPFTDPNGTLSLNPSFQGIGVDLEYRTYGQASFWGAVESEVFWGAGADLFWNESIDDWRPWPGMVLGLNREQIDVRMIIQGGVTRGIIYDFPFVVRLPAIEETLDDIIIGATGERLPIANAYREIFNVSLTLQADGGTAATVKLLDKAISGPNVQAFDAAGAGTSATIDARIRGV